MHTLFCLALGMALGFEPSYQYGVKGRVVPVATGYRARDKLEGGDLRGRIINTYPWGNGTDAVFEDE